MCKLDKVKEDIAHLRAFLLLFAAGGFAIIGFLFSSFEELIGIKIFFAIIGILICLIAVLTINERILKKIDELEDL
jgi:hypothetical protein